MNRETPINSFASFFIIWIEDIYIRTYINRDVSEMELVFIENLNSPFPSNKFQVTIRWKQLSVYFLIHTNTSSRHSSSLYSAYLVSHILLPFTQTSCISLNVFKFDQYTHKNEPTGNFQATTINARPSKFV